jgi:hypothetical protein
MTLETINVYRITNHSVFLVSLLPSVCSFDWCSLFFFSSCDSRYMFHMFRPNWPFSDVHVVCSPFSFVLAAGFFVLVTAGAIHLFGLWFCLLNVFWLGPWQSYMCLFCWNGSCSFSGQQRPRWRLLVHSSETSVTITRLPEDDIFLVTPLKCECLLLNLVSEDEDGRTLWAEIINLINLDHRE